MFRCYFYWGLKIIKEFKGIDLINDYIRSYFGRLIGLVILEFVKLRMDSEERNSKYKLLFWKVEYLVILYLEKYNLFLLEIYLFSFK